MSKNKKIVENYIDGFNKSDHKQILSSLTDDVEWILPGMFHLNGKDEFDREIENPAFEGKPEIVVTRMIEENDVVIAEGTVRTKKRDSGFINLVFCDVFVMKDGLIKKLTSYLMEVK
ncbi:MAG: nuclear transport factor 2 family protein [Ignavibacteriales bacterium]